MGKGLHSFGAAVDLPGGAADYTIGPGDQLGIEVWKDRADSGWSPPDGKISFPLIGEIEAGGKTVAQLKNEIEQKIARYVPDSNTTVEVRQINSLHIYVLGRVNAPGRFILTSNVTVLQALAIAGGPNTFANRKQIRILREKKGVTTMSPLFDYDDVTAGRGLKANILLERGDVIFVP
jgi:polysaccharide export outer membrane protein